MPTRNNELSEWEFELLARSGSDLFIHMLYNRVRIFDRETKSGIDFFQNVHEYLEINVQKQFFFRHGYHNATIYFEDVIEKENFERILATI